MNAFMHCDFVLMQHATMADVDVWTRNPSSLADMLYSLDLPVMLSQVCLENPSELFQKDLKARLGDGWVVAALAQLVADERMLCPGELTGS